MSEKQIKVIDAATRAAVVVAVVFASVGCVVAVGWFGMVCGGALAVAGAFVCYN